MVTTMNQPHLKEWLCDRIGLIPTPDLVCIGNYLNDKLRGVVGYDGYNGASIQMHVAGEGNWFTKDMLYASFDYPFNACDVNMVIGLVPSGNTEAIRFNTHIGFKTAYTLEGAHPDGALILMTMTKQECRYLKQKEICHGPQYS